MYASLANFLKTFSADQPLLWALLVIGVIAATSLTLYGFWELVLRLLFFRRSANQSSTPPRE